MADLGREARDLIELARKRPILIVGGALGLLLLAAAVNRGQGADDGADAELDPELEAEDAALSGESAATGGSLGFGAAYGLPSYGIDGAGAAAFDPFASDPVTQAPEVERTPDGCPLPKPAIPSGLAGKGDWQCVGGAWAWRSTGSGAPAKGKTGPRIVISKGARFVHYRIDKNRLRGEQRTAGSAVTWRTSATPRTMRTYGGSTVRVVQLREGPLQGRWVTIGGSGKRWYPS